MSHRESDRWKSKFARFVMAYGVVRMATELDIHPTAVYQWIRGSSRPKPEHAAIIKSFARKRRTRLTLDDIYGHSRDRRATDQAIAAAIERRKSRGVRRAELLEKRAAVELFVRVRKMTAAVGVEGS
jgi:hypothetical protein